MKPETEQKLADLWRNYISQHENVNIWSFIEFQELIPQIQSILQSEDERVCEWVWDSSFAKNGFVTQCGINPKEFYKDHYYFYCPYCGGKIKEVQPLPQTEGV